MPHSKTGIGFVNVVILDVVLFLEDYESVLLAAIERRISATDDGSIVLFTPDSIHHNATPYLDSLIIFTVKRRMTNQGRCSVRMYSEVVS